VCVSIYIYIHTHTHTHRIYVCVCVCVCVYIYTHTHTHTHFACRPEINMMPSIKRSFSDPNLNLQEQVHWISLVLLLIPSPLIRRFYRNMAPLVCVLLTFKICVDATFIIDDKYVYINHDISELLFHFISENNCSNKCVTTYHIHGDSDCSIKEDNDALNEDCMSLCAEGVSFSSYVSVDNKHCVSSMMRCPIVRQQEQQKRYDRDQHEPEPVLSVT